MTKEEARLTLQENFGLLSFEYPGRISEAIKIAIEVLSQPSLPSGLDEAAEAYRKKVYCGDSEMCQFVREVFKAGAQWRDAKIPKLPDSIDEAAEEYAYNNWEDNDYHTGAREGLPFDAIGHTERCFKACAEWMAGQGWIDDGSMPTETKQESDTLQGHREWTESEPVLAWDSMYGCRVDWTRNGKWMSEQTGGYTGQVCHGIVAWRPIPKYKEK